ncbi:uncharacterized protein THITE_2110477 [Thermothielavioides terrestris NRRL 8126]|uniref:Uncharacterized protein n=1 Tax=Thermothielavioides terrestris (strain ATCC 38088 / NRRL 8126) TaxID=578455 RepID=G2QT50_THETT|nr:uncharacterized protein THITE_2110477 [Thermothielavioides terrestris NRRL 8126]AEO64376.1 hypothetical protein THITE_2110477 [Thermothielavioides terrestris NRRL 8126]
MLSLAALPSLLPNLSNLSAVLRSTSHRPRHDGQHAIPEDDLLNSIWIGLLGVEALMVLGVALRGLVGAVAASRVGAAAQRRWRRGFSVGMASSEMEMGIGHGGGDGACAWGREEVSRGLVVGEVSG